MKESTPELQPATPAGGRGTSLRWLRGGDEFFARLAAELGRACVAVRMEFYVVRADSVGRAVRDHLVAAALRGVQVRLLVDALGSAGLPGEFWAALRLAGGEVREFNPLGRMRAFVRNHCKLVVVDFATALVGGFNLAEEYAGDGVTRGWADCGLELAGVAVGPLAGAFDARWEVAAGGPLKLGPLGIHRRPRATRIDDRLQLIISGPGLAPNGLQVALRSDLVKARDVRIASAYFLPSVRLRSAFRWAARRGARVRLLVGARSDVEVARRAARHLYSGLMRAGVEIYEYQPQVLHAKLFVLDGAAYVGSANLDVRSLYLNYELTVRIGDPGAAAEAAAIFDSWARLAVRVDASRWRNSRSLWEKMLEHSAFWILARLDPFLTRGWTEEPD